MGFRRSMISAALRFGFCLLAFAPNLMAQSSWESTGFQAEGSNMTLTFVCFGTPEKGMVGGNSPGGSDVYRTTNGGVSWTGLPLGGLAGLRACQFTSGDSGYVVLGDDSGNDQVLRTTNGGQSWFSPNAPPEKWLGVVYDIHFLNFNVGYAASERGAFKTTDAGASWSTAAPGTTKSYLRAVFAADANLAYAAGLRGAVHRTSNGGASWDSLRTGFTDDWTALAFTSASTGYLAGTNGSLLKTADSGATWTALATGAGGESLRAIRFTGPDTGYIAADGGRVLRTVNAGQSWTIMQTGLGGFIDLSFPARGIGYAIGASFVAKYVAGASTEPPPPPAPSLATPAHDSMDIALTTSLTWNIAAGATAYHLQLSKDSAFAVLVLNDSTLASPSRSVGPLTASTRYWWRVRARNAEGSGAWSGRSFFTRPEPVALFSGPLAPVLVARGNLEFRLTERARVRVRILDARGALLAEPLNAVRESGRHVLALPPSRGEAYRFLEFRAGEVYHVIPLAGPL